MASNQVYGLPDQFGMGYRDGANAENNDRTVISDGSGQKVFGGESTFIGFADLASMAASSTAFVSRSSPSATIGSPVDYTKLEVKPIFDGQKSDYEGGEVSKSPDVHFEPVVMLTEVDVKTGEEDELIVYSQRAKLYRYDDNQWKERGVGNMKILKHQITGKFRLLMRRDQVHKVACNHTLTADMKLQPMMSSDEAWCWYAHDFSEGDDQKIYNFAIKFKTGALAQDFRVMFEACQTHLKSAAAMQTKTQQTYPATAIK